MADGAPGADATARWFRGPAISLLVIIMATLAFGAPALRSDRVLAGLDFITASDPFTQTDLASGVANPRQGDHAAQLVFPVEFWASVRAGHLQHWEPDVGGGTPLAAAVYNRVLSPFNVLTYSWLPPWAAITASVLLALLTAQLGTWWFARRLRLGHAAATLAGVVYGFSGASVPLLLRIQEVAWFPLVLALLHGVMTSATRRPLWRVGLGIAVAFLWFCGFPGGSVYAMLGVGLTAVGLSGALGGSWREHVARLAAPVAAIVAGTLIAMLQLRPTIAFLSVTAGQDRTFVAQPYIGITRLADVITPRFFGSFADRTWWWTPDLQSARILIGRTSGNHVQAGSALGVVAVASLAAFVRTRAADARLRGLLVVASLLVVAGLSLSYVGGPILWLAQHLPALGETNPSRARFLFILGVALFVGAGLESLAVRLEARARMPVQFRWARLLAATVLLLMGSGLLAGLQAAQSSGNLRLVARAMVVPGAIVLFGGAVLATRWWRARIRPWHLHAAAAVAALELIVGHWGHHPAVSSNAVYPSLPIMASLPEHGEGRFLSARMSPLYVHSTASLDIPDVRTMWPGTLRYEELLAIVEPSVAKRSLAGSVTIVIPTKELDHGHPILDRVAVTDILANAGTRVLDVADTNKTVLDVSTVGHAVEVTLPPITPAAGPSVAWRRVEFLSVVSCPGVPDVTASRDGQTIARIRREVVAGDRVEVGLPDLGSGRVTLAVEGCDLGGVTDVRASLGDTSQVRLREIEGWQRYENVGVRPFIEMTTDVVVVDGPDGWVGPMTQTQSVVVEENAPYPLGTSAEVSITSIGTDHLQAVVEAHDGGALLVVRENHAPGWTAEIDGQPADVIFADHAFRGVWVPQGRHEVTMSYTPDGFRQGAWMAGLGLVLLYALAIAAQRPSVGNATPQPSEYRPGNDPPSAEPSTRAT